MGIIDRPEPCAAEIVDRLHREKAELLDNYRRLLYMTGLVASGKVAGRRVRVDLAALTWELLPEDAAETKEVKE